MKKQKKIFTLITFLLIWLLIPLNNVLANESILKEILSYYTPEKLELNDQISPLTDENGFTYLYTFEKATSIAAISGTSGAYPYILITDPDTNMALTADSSFDNQAIQLRPNEEEKITLEEENLDYPSEIFFYRSSRNPTENTLEVDYLQSGSGINAKRIKWDSSTLFVEGENGGTPITFRLNPDNNTWTVYAPNANRYIAYNESEGFYRSNSGYDLNVWVCTDSTLITNNYTYYRFNDLSHLGYFIDSSEADPIWNSASFVMTIPDMETNEPDAFVITYPGSYEYGWRVATSKVEGSPFYVIPGESISVSEQVNVNDIDYYPIFHVSQYFPPSVPEGQTQEAQTNNLSYWKFGGLFTNTPYYKEYWYPNKGISYPFSGGAQNVRFDYLPDQNGEYQIYLRGNGNNYWLGYNTKTQQFVNCTVSNGQVTTEDCVLVPIRIYANAGIETYTVNFNNIIGEVQNTVITGEYFVLPQLEDITVESIPYTFIGWTVNEEYTGPLALEESVNLYDFNEETNTGGFTAAAIEDLDLVGSGNPDILDSGNVININNQYSTFIENNTINLYPVYAVKGFNNAVAVNDDSNTPSPIIGVADWKPDQTESGYYNPDMEVWLGSIDLEIYRDGVQWGETQTLYFSYHNDDAVDLNIKFVWDELLDNFSNKEAENGVYLPYNSTPSQIQLYNYLTNLSPSEDEDDEDYNLPPFAPSVFPRYDQVEHYVIQDVYAIQGNSEDGLVYQYNWLENYGGQLDNVIGGSTLQIFVTSIYNTEYYLDGELIEEEPWFTDDSIYYATPGTNNLFNPIWNTVTTNMGYQVNSINVNNGLMDPSVTSIKAEDGTEDTTFDPEVLQRGGSAPFAYQINTFTNEIPIAITPESLVPEGKTLTSTSWNLIGQTSSISVPFNSTYVLSGTRPGTGNTEYAYSSSEEETYDGTDPYTFHLYAYTNSPPESEETTLTVTKVASDNPQDLFDFTLNLQTGTNTNYSNPVSYTIYPSNTYGSVNNGTNGSVSPNNGNITFSLASGGSIEFTIPDVDVKYTVIETPVQGYNPTYFIGTSNQGSSGASSNLTSSQPDQDVLIVNSNTITETTTGLNVMKVLEEINSSTNTQQFAFNVTFTENDEPYTEEINYNLVGTGTVDSSTNKTDTVKPDEEGNVPFTLTAGSYVFFELPTGVEYSVTETKAYEYNSITPSNNEGTIGNSPSNNPNVIFINQPYGSLTVQKNAPNASTNEVFTFNVNFKNGNTNYNNAISFTKTGTVNVTGNSNNQVQPSNGNVEFTMTAGSTITFTGLPIGITYTVEETNSLDYTPSYVNAKSELSVSNPNRTAVITNTKNVSPTISISKQQSIGTGTLTADPLTTTPGATVNYFLTVTNNSTTTAATNITVTDTLPTGTTLVNGSISSNGSYNEQNRSITWTIPSIGAKQATVVSFSVTLPTTLSVSPTNFRNVGAATYNGTTINSNEVMVTCSNAAGAATGTTTTPTTTTTNKTTTTTTSPKTGVESNNVSMYVAAIVLSVMVIAIVYISNRRKLIKK